MMTQPSENSSPKNPYSYDGAAVQPKLSKHGLPEGVVYWIPTDHATLHNGDPIPEKMLFPFVPPPELGEVYTVYSEWFSSNFVRFKLDKNCRHTIWAILIIMLFLIPFSIGFLIHLFFGASDIPGKTIGLLVISPWWLILYFGYRQLWNRQWSYVCENGYYKLAFKKQQLTQTVRSFNHCESLVFLGLFIPEENNGQFASISLKYDDQTSDKFTLDERLSPDTGFEFATSVEFAWTAFFLRKVAKIIEENQSYEFPAGPVVFRFFKHSLELVAEDQIIPLTKQNIDLLRWGYDWTFKFSIITRTSVSKNHHYNIDIKEIPNFRALFVLLEERLEIEFDGMKLDLHSTWHPSNALR